MTIPRRSAWSDGDYRRTYRTYYSKYGRTMTCDSDMMILLASIPRSCWWWKTPEIASWPVKSAYIYDGRVGVIWHRNEFVKNGKIITNAQ